MSNMDVAVTLRLVNGLSGPARGAVDDLKRVSAAAKGLDGAGTGRLATDLGRAAAAAGKTGSELRTAAGAAKSLDGAGAGRLAADLGRVTAAAGKAGSEMRMVGTATATLGHQLSAAAAAGGRIAGSVSGARGAIADAGAAARSLAAELERAAAAGSRASRTMPRGNTGTARAGTDHGSDRKTAPDDGGTSLFALGRGAMLAAGGVYAVRRATQATVGEAITFEKAWADVVKKVNDAPNPAAMEELQRAVRQTGIDLGIPREKVAALTAEAAAAGTKFDDLIRFTRLAAKASVGWDMTPEDASEKLAYIRAGTGMTIAEVETLANKINALGDNSPAKERDIVEMFGRAGAAAKAAGVDFDTSLAFLTAGRSTGMQPEVMARFWTSFTGKLATAGAGGRGAKDLAAGLKILGLTTEQVAAGMKKDEAGTILDIFDRLAKAAEPAKAALKIAGGEWWDEMMRVAQAGAEARKQLDLVRNPMRFHGSLDNNLSVQLATTANHLERLKSLATEVGDRLGRWALPGINDAVKGLISLMDEYDRRTRLRDAAKPPAEKGPDGDPQAGWTEDPVARAAQEARRLTRRFKDLALDNLVAPKPTDDPARDVARKRAQDAADAEAEAAKRREEAALYAERSRKAPPKSEARRELERRSEAARAEVGRLDADASLSRRGAGPAAARDMTDVEVGQKAAGASVAERRGLRERIEQLQARIAELQGALSATENRFVQDPSFGQAMERGAMEARIEGLKAKLGELVAEYERVGAAAKGKLSMDLSAEGAQAMASLAAGITAGGAAAVSAALGVASQVKAALAVSASVSIGGPARAAASGGSPAASVRSGTGATTVRTALVPQPSPTIAPSLGALASAGPAERSERPAATRPATRGGFGGGGISIQNASFHGVRDVAGLQRELAAFADRSAKDARDGALHDVA